MALVIAAAAAAVILGHVRTLMLRAEREQAHQLEVLRLQNDALRLVHGGAQGAEPPRLDGDRLLVFSRDAERDGLPPVVVRNFSALGETLPAVGLAYTPFQVFSVEREPYALHRIARALPPPQGAEPLAAGASLRPEMLQSPGPEKSPEATPAATPASAPAAASAGAAK